MPAHALRDYQLDGKTRVYAAWHAGRRVVMLVLPTGAGKTVVFANILGEFQGAACAVAHRAELVTQMSVALARENVRHRVIGPATLQRACSSAHLDRLKRDYVDPNGRVAVASVDTLIGMDPATPWLHQVGLWIQDEAHHVLAENKWGKACALFPNAYGLGVTATPTRADGKGLGAHAEGLMQELIVGPTMRELINRGYLTEYRVFAPPSDIDLSAVPVTDSGDYSPVKLRGARRRSHITGDVVQHYLRIAPGKLGVTFDTDIESATETAQAYRDAGVPAEVVTSKTPDHVRSSILRRFERREILELVNVDLFGEGFDLPAIEVVSMARPTQSYSLYCQQFGRALRPLEGKTHAIIIDHVGINQVMAMAPSV
jgi:superfamily II DNA or RNA helicase